MNVLRSPSFITGKGNCKIITVKKRQSDFVPIVFTGSNHQLETKKRVQQKDNPEHMHPSDGNAYEIVYPNGVKLRIPEGADLTQIRSLILLTQ